MKIRLGPLPQMGTVKVTINVPVTLKAKLDQYAEIHAATWNEPVEAESLIPLILDQFISKDKAFKAAMRQRRNEPDNADQS